MLNHHRRFPQRSDRRRVVDPWSSFDGGRGEEEEFAVGFEEGAEGFGKVAVGDLRKRECEFRRGNKRENEK
jgi:hypothetical protein